jgi:transcriptional regulator with XRE-family HTH domain
MRIARETARLTQKQCAERVGVSFQVVSMWEKGHRLPSQYALKKYARECGVDLDWLLQGGGTVRRITCPVCWRDVAVTGLNRIVVLHNDTAHNRCPMVGQQAPIEPVAVMAS